MNGTIFYVITAYIELVITTVISLIYIVFELILTGEFKRWNWNHFNKTDIKIRKNKMF